MTLFMIETKVKKEKKEGNYPKWQWREESSVNDKVVVEDRLRRRTGVVEKESLETEEENSKARGCKFKK